MSSRASAGSAPARPGMEDPRRLASHAPLLDRSFAFVDLCGFTTFTASNWEHAATEVLRSFRHLVREVSSRRGVAVSKWLGDGAMLVGAEIGPTIATSAELLARSRRETLPVRAGVAHGGVLLFEGDDYVGRPVNLAARFCQAARPGELLGVGYDTDQLPAWTRVASTRHVELPGLGLVCDAQRIDLVEGFDGTDLDPTAAS